MTTEVADRIKDIGFEYAMISGTTIAVADITIPEEKVEILQNPNRKLKILQRDYRRGLLTEQESNERIIEIWQNTTKEVADAVKKSHGSRSETFQPWPTPAQPKAVLVQFLNWLVCAV